jgi:hypothetical protein
MPNLKGVKTDKVTIRLPEETIAELDELASKSGLYRASFFGVALVAGARSMAHRLEPPANEREEQPPESPKGFLAFMRAPAEVADPNSPVGRIRVMAGVVASVSTRMAAGQSGMFPTDRPATMTGTDEARQLRMLMWQFDHLKVAINRMQREFDEQPKEKAPR